MARLDGRTDETVASETDAEVERRIVASGSSVGGTEGDASLQALHWRRRGGLF